MDDLPQDLAARRQSILARVTKRGRRLRRRRIAATTALVVLAISVPLAAVAVSLDGDTGAHHVSTLTPSTTTPPTTNVAPSTTAPPIVPATTAPTTTLPVVSTTMPVEPVTTPSTEVPSETTTTALNCRNSGNPQCGPFHYDPPLVNEPAKLVVAKVAPAVTREGRRVTFTLHASDPDSFLAAGCVASSDFGDGSQNGCGPSCSYVPGAGRFGPWDPPPARRGDATYTVTHVYKAAGTYTSTFTVVADECGPRRSEASASVTVHVEM